MTATLIRPRPFYATLRAYIALTKPQIVELLLVTTVPAMVLAARGAPSLRLVLLTLAGGFLAAGGAEAINSYVDRDIDEVMARTKGRPLPLGQIAPRRALWFGILLGVASVLLFALTVNLLSALLTLTAYLFYVVVYTLWLKRATPQNIVIGGAAGAFPPLIGWAAVTNHLAPAALVLFAIVFLWTPPHFWSLALKYEDQYRAAGVPMLPVVRGAAETRRQIVWYSIGMAAVSLLLVPVGGLGLIYLAAALLLGGWFVRQALRLRHDPAHQSSMRLFAYSITYLALLYGLIIVDQAARGLLHHRIA